MRWLWALVAAIATAVLLAGCAAVTDGHGTTAPTPAAPSSSLRPTTSPTTSPATSPTTSPPGTTSSGSTPSAGTLECSSGSIAPRGAPFCYPLPGGFADMSARADYGAGWTYRSLIGLGGREYIEVLATVVATSTDGLSATQLRAYYNRAGLITKGRLGIVSASTVATISVDGARAFRQTGRYQDGVDATFVRAYLGRTVVSVSCQTKDQAVRITAGCAQILARLQIART